MGLGCDLCVVAFLMSEAQVWDWDMPGARVCVL